MAVNSNPYRRWFDSKKNSDYRDPTTQAFSLVRQQLSQEEYLLRSNRVNPGPKRNSRVRCAEQQLQVPHDFSKEDMWGWQKWADPKYCGVDTELATGLVERCDETDIQYGGVPYSPCSKDLTCIPDSDSDSDTRLVVRTKPSAPNTGERGVRFFSGSEPPGVEAIFGDLWYDTTSGVTFQKVPASDGSRRVLWVEASSVDLEVFDEDSLEG